MMNPLFGFFVNKKRRHLRQLSHEACSEILEQREMLDGAASAAASLAYLRDVMDQYHDRIPVYDDVSSAGNHFHGWAKIPGDVQALDISGAWTQNVHSGATAIRAEYRTGLGADWGGFYFLNGTLPPGATAPVLNFGTEPDAGIDLTGATQLTFWARGHEGGEQIEFFVAGVGRNAFSGLPIAPFPDSSPRWPGVGTVFTLSSEWQQFSIELTGLDLSYVLGGFGWVASQLHNPGGAVFYLDDIQYELAIDARNDRINQPHFLVSYTTLPNQPDPFDDNKDDDIDFVLRNLAFTYDNALSLLAFLADNDPNTQADSLRRAQLLGDAFVYASQHDRSFNDGKLRTAYAAGDISLPPGWTPNDRTGTVPIPGFYYEPSGQFFEVEQEAIDVGNNAWAMISLLALYRRTNDTTYLNTARQLGEFIRSVRNDMGTYRGFLGGFAMGNPESTPGPLRTWASTEHNLDIYSAFAAMHEVTGESVWQEGATHAMEFVEAMWDDVRNVYLAGTLNKETRNQVPNQLPLDAQAWSVLSLPATIARHPGVLDQALSIHGTNSDGYEGFDFNDDKDGVWFEGTAQMAVAFAAAGRVQDAGQYRLELRRAQEDPVLGAGPGIPAASRDGLTTGFFTALGDDFKYFRRDHIAVAAWNVFAQLSFNPFNQITVTLSGDTNQDGVIDITDLNNVRNHFGSGVLGGPPVDGDTLPFDGIVDIDDLNRVRNNFGATVAVPKTTTILIHNYEFEASQLSHGPNVMPYSFSKMSLHRYSLLFSKSLTVKRRSVIVPEASLRDWDAVLVELASGLEDLDVLP